MKRRSYNVRLRHSHYAPLNGEITVTVCDATGKPGFVFVSGPKLGCSRDYCADDRTAISYLAAEHGAQVVAISDQLVAV